jgi:hypothetical protein
MQFGETKTWLAAQPDGRFAFVFTPRQRFLAQPCRGFFSKAARSVLRHIRAQMPACAVLWAAGGRAARRLAQPTCILSTVAGQR